MRYLGIDYGSKRVGIATSDEAGTMAFPKSVLPNNKTLIPTIKEICDTEHISAIVVGESLDYKMKPNVIMEKITPFVEELKVATGLPIYLEQEFMTSFAAERFQGKGELTDASAAALILQSYLDKRKNADLPDKN